MGVAADGMTIVGLGVGLGAAAAIATQRFGVGLLLLGLSRLFDGLDGAVARSSAPTDRGGYLDIVCDFAFYAAIPLAFAFADAARNALPAAALLAGFVVTGTSFLAFATVAAKRGLETTAQGRKSFFYSFGVMEGDGNHCVPRRHERMAAGIPGSCVDGRRPLCAHRLATNCSGNSHISLSGRASAGGQRPQ
jgi:hypothetical protein